MLFRNSNKKLSSSIIVVGLAFVLYCLTFSSSFLVAADDTAPEQQREEQEQQRRAADFNWDITDEGINVKFDDESEDNELQISYNVSNQNVIFDIRDYDTCMISSTVLTGGNALVGNPIEGTPYPQGPNPTHKDYTVEIDIKQNLIALSTPSSAYWTTDGDNDEKGTIKFCLRIDLVLDDGVTSVNFHETKVTIDIDMTKGFDVVGINGNRTQATETNKNTTLDYYVEAYQCVSLISSYVPVLLKQGSTCGVCIETNSTTDVYVSSITRLDFTQGSFTYEAIKNSAPTGLTSVDCSNEKCFTQTQMIAAFFSKANPDPIDISGDCVMKFGNGRRLFSVRSGGSNENKYNKDNGKENTSPFDLQVFLDNNDNDFYTTDANGNYDDTAADISSTTNVGNTENNDDENNKKKNGYTIAKSVVTFLLVLFAMSVVLIITTLTKRYNEKKEHIEEELQRRLVTASS